MAEEQTDAPVVDIWAEEHWSDEELAVQIDLHSRVKTFDGCGWTQVRHCAICPAPEGGEFKVDQCEPYARAFTILYRRQIDRVKVSRKNVEDVAMVAESRANRRGLRTISD